MVSLSIALPAALMLGFVYWTGWCIYALFYHPAAKFPGPRLAAISELWIIWTLFSGRSALVIQDLHRKYGPIVRISPNELSFDSAGAFRTINSSLFVKSSFYEHFGKASPVGHIRDKEQHAIARKRLAPGFSTSALRSQENVIHSLVDLFIDQLRGRSEKDDGGILMGEAFTWLTFDIIGELAFGDSFNAVQDWKSSFWVSLLLDPKWLFVFLVDGLRARSPVVSLLLPFMLPRNAGKMFAQHTALTKQKCSSGWRQCITKPGNISVTPAVSARAGGAYQCLGKAMAYLEMRITLAKLLFSFDVEVVNDPGDLLQDSKYYVLWVKPDIKVKLYPVS
ncbi:cytochrome p450 [Hirsutella rhossiliensis]